MRELNLLQTLDGNVSARDTFTASANKQPTVLRPIHTARDVAWQRRAERRFYASSANTYARRRACIAAPAVAFSLRVMRNLIIWFYALQLLG